MTQQPRCKKLYRRVFPETEALSIVEKKARLAAKGPLLGALLGRALRICKARYFFSEEANAGMNPPVLTFTAYANTGKTTYLEKLIPCLKKEGLRIAVIKHDGHDFQADIEGKDSWRFAQAGADVVAVASQNRFAYFQYAPATLEDVLRHIPNVDLIITEGYKHGPFPKIALFRADFGKGLSVPAEECLAIVGDYPGSVDCPVFPLDNPQPLAEHLLHLLRAGTLI